MSLFKFGFTSYTDKVNEEKKQKAERKQTKKMKKKSEKAVFFSNGKMLLNGLIQHIKHDQHLQVLFFSLLPSTNYLQVHCSKPVSKCSRRNDFGIVWYLLQKTM